jgi:DDE superfamily endonuclease
MQSFPNSMKKADLDLYTDYLLSSYGFATATGLSEMVNKAVSQDKVTRFLSTRQYTSKDLWAQVKPTVRWVQSDEDVLIFDDTIQEKAWTDECELMCWRYDHVSGRNVRGINLLDALYNSNGASIPVAFELVTKPIWYSDLQTRKLKRKNELSQVPNANDQNAEQSHVYVDLCSLQVGVFESEKQTQPFCHVLQALH